MDVGGTSIKAALLSPSGDILSGGGKEAPVDSGGNADAIERRFRAVAAHLADRAKPFGNIVGAGISIPGPFDYREGRFLMEHKYRSVKGISLRPWLTDEFGPVPVRFVHDAVAFLLGALASPDVHRYRRVAAVTLGTGLGFAWAVDGTAQTDAQGGPAISLFDRPYRNGIAEDYVSRRGIRSRYNEVSGDGDGLDVADIASQADKGDAGALRVFRDTGTMLGEILRPVLLDQEIECLVIGGQIARASRFFEDSLKDSLNGITALRAVQTASDLTALPLLGAFLHVLQCVGQGPTDLRDGPIRLVDR